MSKLKQLDYTIQYVYSNKRINTFHRKEFQQMHDYIQQKLNSAWITDSSITDEEIRDCRAYLEKLDKDGYVRRNDGDYIITLDGILFFENAKFPFNDMPYIFEGYKRNWKFAWEIGKTIVIVLNALLLLYFAYLQTRFY